MLSGIDVSNWQGVIDWRQVKASGIQFAGIKASEGTAIADDTFSRNWQHCGVSAIRRIAYHFFDPAQDGATQAEFFHRAVRDGGRFGKGDAAMLDIETTEGIAPELIKERAEAFIQNILLYTHVGVYIYTGSYYWQSVGKVPASDILGRCPLWAASWGAFPSPIPQWSNGASMWQYSSNVYLPGISGAVDSDRFLGNWDQYNILAVNGGRH